MTLRASRGTSTQGRIRFHTEIDANGCWLWTGRIDRHGYGSITLSRRASLAHRVAYEAFVGQIPPGLVIDHLCRVRRCCNPAHMEPVPMGVNTLRGFGASARNKRKTHCKNGHPFSGENLYLGKDRRGCRACNLAAVQRYQRSHHV